MATLTQGRKEELAKELETASTWVNGPRRVKILAIAEELRGTDPDEVEVKVSETIARQAGALTVPENKAGDNEQK